MAKIKKWCVMASHGEDATRQEYAFGDGITAPSRRLYAICGTKEEAEYACAALYCSKTMTKARMPGDGIIYPHLEVREFDPLDYVGSQNRDQYTGLRYKNLVRDLHEKAKADAEAL